MVGQKFAVVARSVNVCLRRRFALWILEFGLRRQRCPVLRPNRIVVAERRGTVAHNDEDRQLAIPHTVIGLVHADEIAGEGESLTETIGCRRIEYEAMFGPGFVHPLVFRMTRGLPTRG